MKWPAQKMPYDTTWIFRLQENPTGWFKLASKVTVGLVGLVAKILIVCLNNSKIFNVNRLESLVESRPKGVPLLTVGSHWSCFDDPAIWGCFKLKNVCSATKIRWSMAAHDICFNNALHSYVFGTGKCIPTIRGAGVYQPAVDLCIKKLRQGEWVHIFPEGKVNMEREYMRLKWGIGRILYELYPITPIIIPICHEGMAELLPNYPPYYFRLFKNLTFNFGNPIDISETMKMIFDKKIDEVEARRLITDVIQRELESLRDETEKLHVKVHSGSS